MSVSPASHLCIITINQAVYLIWRQLLHSLWLGCAQVSLHPHLHVSGRKYGNGDEMLIRVSGPFELAKNVVQTSVLMSYRSQASPDAVQDPRVRSLPRLGTIQAFRKIISRHGFRGLYTGYHLHAIRDTIGTGLYFGIYETVKQIIAKEMGKPAQTPFGPPMVAGALCGTIPWLVVSFYIPVL